jgi:hypothetical protein
VSTTTSAKGRIPARIDVPIDSSPDASPANPDASPAKATPSEHERPGRKTRANYEKIAWLRAHDDLATTPVGRYGPCGELQVTKMIQDLKMARTVLKVWPLPAPPQVLAPWPASLASLLLLSSRDCLLAW